MRFIRRLQPGARVRTMVVCDAAVLRQLIVGAIERDPAIEVVGSAPNGTLALERIARLEPDVVSLDLGAPAPDCLDTLGRIRRDFPEIPVVAFNSRVERAAAATFEALWLGADDYVHKARPAAPLSLWAMRWCQKLSSFSGGPRRQPPLQSQCRCRRASCLSGAQLAISLNVQNSF